MSTITKSNNSRTRIFPSFSKYGNFCTNDVLDVKPAVSDAERSKQCCDCMGGFILLPFTPVMIICDLVSYPFRVITNHCKK